MDTLITNIGQLVTPIDDSLHGSKPTNRVQIISDSTLAIRDGRIVGNESPSVASNTNIIDAKGCVVLPGLIDPFWVMPRLPAWIDDVPQARLQSRDLSSWSLRLLRRSVRMGVTTVEVKCSYDSEFAGLGHLTQQHEPRVIGTLLASLPSDRQEREQLMSTLIGEVIPEIRRRRLATFCDIGWNVPGDFTTEAMTILRAAIGVGLRPKLHIPAHSLVDGLQELLQSLDIAAIGCTSSPSCSDGQTIDYNIPLVQLPVTKQDVVEPRLCDRARVEQGPRMALGTGNGWTDITPQSMWSVLSCAMDSLGLTLMEAIEACTLGNAFAVEQSHEIGSLEPGKRADLLIVDLADFREIPAAADSPPIVMVMIGGNVVHSL